MSERTRVSVAPRASLSERNAGGAWARLVGLGVLQGLIASLLSVLVALGVDALMPEGAASSVGVAALICAGLVAAFASAAWVRSRELFEQRSVGEIHADHVRGVILERLQELPASAPERTAASSSLHRFRRHLAAVSDWGATGYAGMVTTAAALASAGLTLGLWAPLASLFAVLLVVAMLAGALAHGADTAATLRVAGEDSKVQESGPPAILHPGRIPFSAAVIAGAVIALGVTGVMLIRGLVTQQIGPATAAAALSLAATFIPQVLAALRIPSAYERRNHALETITRWLDKPTLLRITPHAPDLVRGPGGLEFRDARVLGCLEGLTATAPAGNAIALSGRDVMARSTVLALAARLLDPDWGHVYLDGQDLSCYSDASAHRLVGLASSRRLPSEGTVETRLLTRDDVPGAWMSKALGWCEVDKLICELPEGSVTQMRDPRLTPGQRLRLSLAYALLMRPSVLLLDDTLDPLDAAAVTSLERVMNGFEGTLLIVTQNLDHLAMADEVWYLDGGRLLESGPPSELLAFDGPTAALFGLGDAASA